MDFKYTPLDPQGRVIRVLKLQEDCNIAAVDRPLRFDLAIITLRDAPNGAEGAEPAFYAMSYAWGENPQPAPIVLNRQHAIVPSSAIEALRAVLSNMHKAGLSNSTYIWIDAICINQKDQAEKSHQVAMMGDIYSQAYVLVWWGDDGGDGTTDSALETLQILSDDYHKWITSERQLDDNDDLDSDEKKQLPYWNVPHPPCNISALAPLLSSRWFSRLWVVQEIALARNHFCFRGITYIPWSIFSSAVRWLNHRPDLSDWSWYESDAFSVSLVMVDVFCRQAALRDTTAHRILSLNVYLQASQPHDRIFALAASMGSSELAKPDYGRPLQDVYAEATFFAMRDVMTLDPLRLTFVSNEDAYEMSDEHWPSWVPRYHALDVEALQEAQSFFDAETCHAGDSVSLRLGKQCAGNVIEVDGVILCSIASVYSPVPQHQHDSMALGSCLVVLEAYTTLIKAAALETSPETLYLLSYALPQQLQTVTASDRAASFAASLLQARKTITHHDPDLE